MSGIKHGKPVVNVGAIFKHAKEDQAKGRGPLERDFSFVPTDMDTYVPPPDVVAHRNPDLSEAVFVPLNPVHELGLDGTPDMRPLSERHPELAVAPIDLDRSEYLAQQTMNVLNDPVFIAERDRRMYEMTADYVESRIEEAEASPPLCMILVGLPGSGKSTLSKTLIEMHSPDRILHYASSDAYIERLALEQGSTYNALWAKHIDAATNDFQKTINFAVRNKHDILIDRTNIDKKSRAKFINRLKVAGYRLIAFDVTCSEDVLHERNEVRKQSGRSIPEGVLRNFMERYEAPTVMEGFDHVIKE